MADRGPQGVDVIVGELCGSYKLYLPTARLDYGNKATSVISVMDSRDLTSYVDLLDSYSLYTQVILMYRIIMHISAGNISNIGQKNPDCILLPESLNARQYLHSRNY